MRTACLLPGADRTERLCKMAAEARERLLPWAQQEGLTSTFDPLYEKLGAHEGVGGLLRLAALDPDGTGRPTDEQMGAFLRESEQLFEDIRETLNQFVVVAALSFTVAAPLAVHGLYSFDPADASLGGDGSTALAAYSGWLRPGAMHALHWASGVLLALSVHCSFRAITLCFLLIPTFSFYMPDAESKLRYFMQNYRKICYVWPYTWVSVGLLLLALPCLAARISPVACMCAAIPALGVFHTFFTVCVAYGDEAARVQQEIARRMLVGRSHAGSGKYPGTRVAGS